LQAANNSSAVLPFNKKSSDINFFINKTLPYFLLFKDESGENASAFSLMARRQTEQYTAFSRAYYNMNAIKME